MSEISTTSRCTVSLFLCYGAAVKELRFILFTYVTLMAGSFMLRLSWYGITFLIGIV